jgi:hypothetical protein
VPIPFLYTRSRAGCELRGWLVQFRQQALKIERLGHHLQLPIGLAGTEVGRGLQGSFAR